MAQWEEVFAEQDQQSETGGNPEPVPKSGPRSDPAPHKSTDRSQLIHKNCGVVAGISFYKLQINSNVEWQEVVLFNTLLTGKEKLKKLKRNLYHFHLRTKWNSINLPLTILRSSFIKTKIWVDIAVFTFRKTPFPFPLPQLTNRQLQKEARSLWITNST